MFPFTIQAVSQLSTYLIIGIVLLENNAFLSITTEVTNMMEKPAKAKVVNRKG